MTGVKSFGKTFGHILCISILNLKYTSDWRKTPGTFYTKGPSIKTLASISSISCTVSRKTNTSEGKINLLLSFIKCSLNLPSVVIENVKSLWNMVHFPRWFWGEAKQ